jgi:hypothetical protein
MRTVHLTDEILQERLDSGRFENAEHARHYRKCPVCRDTAARYRLLGRWLSESEPSFALPPDFADSVLDHLPGRDGHRSGRTVMFWILGGVLGTAGAGFAILRLQWFQPFAAFGRTASSIFQAVTGPLAVCIQEFNPGAAPFAYKLMMSCLLFLLAGILDAVMRHFKEVLVDKNR